MIAAQACYGGGGGGDSVSGRADDGEPEQWQGRHEGALRYVRAVGNLVWSIGAPDGQAT